MECLWIHKVGVVGFNIRRTKALFIIGVHLAQIIKNVTTSLSCGPAALLSLLYHSMSVANPQSQSLSTKMMSTSCFCLSVVSQCAAVQQGGVDQQW